MTLELRAPVEAHLEPTPAERWGVAIDYLKARVEGRVFENDAVRLVVSPEGFYCQFAESPGSFYGALRSVAGETLSDAEAMCALWEAISLYRSGEGRVLALYGPRYREREDHLFLGTYVGLDPFERGQLRIETPLFFRADVDALEPTALVGGRRGVAFLVRTREGENVLLRVPQTGRAPAVVQGVRE